MERAPSGRPLPRCLGDRLIEVRARGLCRRPCLARGTRRRLRPRMRLLGGAHDRCPRRLEAGGKLLSADRTLLARLEAVRRVRCGVRAQQRLEPLGCRREPPPSRRLHLCLPLGVRPCVLELPLQAAEQILDLLDLLGG